MLKRSKLRLLAPLTALLVIMFFTTAHLFRKQRCQIVYEKMNSDLAMKVTVNVMCY